MDNFEENQGNPTDNSPYSAPNSNNFSRRPLTEAGPLEPLLASAGWLKFLGIFSIIMGALFVLTITGILVAWVPIWIGILLYQAGDRLSPTSDNYTLYEGSDKLRLAIKIFGIYIIVSFVLSIFAVIAMMTLGLAMFAGMQ